MNRRSLRNMVIVAALATAFTVFTSAANAGWGHLQGFYGTYGGWGCAGVSDPCCDPCYTPCRPASIPRYTVCRPAYDPCSTCYDPCSTYRVGPLQRLRYRLATHHYAYYGYGVDGWNGCGLWSSRWTCCPTGGCDPCGCDSGWDQSWGSSEGTIIEGPDVAPAAPQAPTPAAPTNPTPAWKAPLPPPPAADMPPTLPPTTAPAPAAPSIAPPAPGKQTSLGPRDALLTVRVPASAVVFVNGVPTRSTGEVRRYVSRNLTPGFQYTYEVRVVTNRDGHPVTETRNIHLRAGRANQLAFAGVANNVETMLTLHVPSDARVVLAGQPMQGSGAVRTFRTQRLAAGEVWQGYTVQVVVQENGQTLAKEKNIALTGGQKSEMTFEFGLDRLASAK